MLVTSVERCDLSYFSVGGANLQLSVTRCEFAFGDWNSVRYIYRITA